MSVQSSLERWKLLTLLMSVLDLSVYVEHIMRNLASEDAEPRHGLGLCMVSTRDVAKC